MRCTCLFKTENGEEISLRKNRKKKGEGERIVEK